jgi:bifunctional non-homologous end joining protein LigD
MTADKKRDKALQTYRDKRRFDESPEPAGGAAEAGARFVIQKHDATRLHYDFRLELDGVLLSWAVTKGPSYQTGVKRLAVRTEVHPLEYGGFEGTIPAKNYGGGTVMLWDRGTWEPNGDPHAGLAAGKLAMVLHGERLRGHWALVRLRADKAGKSTRENWLLIKEKDEFANTREDLLDTETLSVATGRSMTEIADAKPAGAPPAFAPPMLATLVEDVPAGDGLAFEIKYDGYRALIAADGPAVKIYTRSGLDWTARFSAVANAVAAKQFDRVLIDTEIVVLDRDGRSDFGALVSALETGKGALSCFAFDLLLAAGRDWRGAPLRDRQAALQTLIGKTKAADVLQRSEVFAGDGAALLRTACANGLEGLIAKRLDAPYRAGRSRDWLKLKCGHNEEFVVIGFAGSPARRAFASLLVAQHEQGRLRYAGRVGSGFSDEMIARLAAWRDGHKAQKPASDDVPAAIAKGAVWVKPGLVVQVKSAGWTRDRYVRHGVFSGVREDKALPEVTRERAAPARAPRARLTHPERVLYPALDITKGDVAAYIEAVAPLMMPLVTGRFMSLLRAPHGVEGKTFFQRHPSAGFGAAWAAQAIATKGEAQTYIYCETPAALAGAVQMGALEFHIWGSRVKQLERPDRIVFDLDPDDGMDFELVKQGARRMREVLDAVGLQSLALLSGGKGIHVVVPVKPTHEWPAVKQFAADIAALVATDQPDRYVATMSKAKRHGKIFIDHFRNERGATAVAPYSPRARGAAAVAWPVTWEALSAIPAADHMTITRALAAIDRGDTGWPKAAAALQTLSPRALRAVAARH